MRKFAWFTLLLTLALLSACSKSVVVSVPPRMDLSNYDTIGIVEFGSNADRAINARATQLFQEHVQAAQPGTRFLELGDRESVLAAVGARQFNAETLRQVGEKYRVAAIFVGDIAYSAPKTDVRISDIDNLEGGVRTEIRGDISSKLFETRTGASVWSSSAWAKRQIGRLSVSAEHGVSGAMSDSNPRTEMLPALMFHLTHDFRPGSVRRRVE